MDLSIGENQEVMSNQALMMCSKQEMKKPKPQEQAQPCPRCESTNTKFCYYNNYSLSQPRYFCKSCRRYWTKGGTLRNVPVGGGCRKKHRPSSTRIITQHQHQDQDHQPTINSTQQYNNNDSFDLTYAFSRLQQNNDQTALGFDDQHPISLFGNPNVFDTTQSGNNFSGFVRGSDQMVVVGDNHINNNNLKGGLGVKEEYGCYDGYMMSRESENPNKILFGYPWQHHHQVHHQQQQLNHHGENYSYNMGMVSNIDGFGSSLHGLLSSSII